MVRKPTQMEAFDALYILASKDGREQALFGDSISLARPAFEKSLIGAEYPQAYLEFPLLGAPRFDLLTVHSQVQPGDRFAPGAGFGYQAMYDWFASVRPDAHDDANMSCGIELDTGAGEVEKAGVYLQYRSRDDLIAPFLESIGESGRLDSYLSVKQRLLKGWGAAYIGLFPGRPGTPLRIGGYMSGLARSACAQSATNLAAAFDRIGFGAYDAPMLERCREFLELAPGVDFQFDVMPDGSLGPTFGLSLSFNETYPRDAQACMSQGYGARIMEKFEHWGLADERWKLIADAAFARHVPFERDDGTEGRLALCILFNYAKVKFTDAHAQPAKFYFILKADELDA